jgi:hypothetical protein
VNRFHLLDFYLKRIKIEENKRKKKKTIDFKIVNNSPAVVDTLRIPTKMPGSENGRI